MRKDKDPRSRVAWDSQKRLGGFLGPHSGKIKTTLRTMRVWDQLGREAEGLATRGRVAKRGQMQPQAQKDKVGTQTGSQE